MCWLFRRKKKNKPVAEIRDYHVSIFDTELYHLINDYRGESMFFPELANVAYTHCEYMAGKKTTSHDNFTDRSETIRQLFPNVQVMECVAYGFKSPEGVLHGWKKSVMHDTILKKDWDAMGCASLDGYVCCLMIKFKE